MTSHNPKINDFLCTVEAVLDGELTIEEMYFTYTNSDGYWSKDTLDMMQVFSDSIQNLITLGKERRN